MTGTVLGNRHTMVAKLSMVPIFMKLAAMRTATIHNKLETIKIHK